MDVEDRAWMREAYAEDPPEWATWEAYSMEGVHCSSCGAWMAVVRPGKTQCDNPVCIAKSDVQHQFDTYYATGKLS